MSMRATGRPRGGVRGYIWKMGLILIGCTVVTLLFGALAGKTAAEACAQQAARAAASA